MICSSRIGAWLAATRRDAVERDHPLREGDLVIVDAGRATLQVLGQDPSALAIHDGLRALGAARRRLSATDETADDVLAVRGDHLRARHRSEAVLARLADPTLARFAVREILMGTDLAGTPGGPGERGRLLAVLLANPRVGPIARDDLAQAHAEMSRLHRDVLDDAARGIPAAASVHEVLALRAQARPNPWRRSL